MEDENMMIVLVQTSDEEAGSPFDLYLYTVM
jgi:hypothetical protein